MTTQTIHVYLLINQPTQLTAGHHIHPQCTGNYPLLPGTNIQELAKVRSDITNTDSDHIFIHVASKVKLTYMHSNHMIKNPPIFYSDCKHLIIPMLLQGSGRSCWCWCLLLIWRTVRAKRLDLVRENQGIRSNIIAARQGSGRGRRILTRKDPVVKCARTHVHIHCVCISVCMDTYDIVLCSYIISQAQGTYGIYCIMYFPTPGDIIISIGTTKNRPHLEVKASIHIG